MTEKLTKSIPLPPRTLKYDEDRQIIDFPNNIRPWASESVNPVTMFHALRKSATMRLVVSGMNTAATAVGKWRSDGNPLFGTNDTSILSEIDHHTPSGDEMWERFGFKSYREREKLNSILFKSLAAWGRIVDLTSKEQEPDAMVGKNTKWIGVYNPFRPHFLPDHFIAIVRELWSEKQTAHHVVNWPGWMSYFFLRDQDVLRFMYEAHARGQVNFYASGSVMDLSVAAPGMAFSGGRQVPKVAKTLWDIGE